MAAPKIEKNGIIYHYRYLNGKMVFPIKVCNKYMSGMIDNVIIMDEYQKPIPYKYIGISAKEYWQNGNS